MHKQSSWGDFQRKTFLYQESPYSLRVLTTTKALDATWTLPPMSLPCPKCLNIISLIVFPLSKGNCHILLKGHRNLHQKTQSNFLPYNPKVLWDIARMVGKMTRTSDPTGLWANYSIPLTVHSGVHNDVTCLHSVAATGGKPGEEWRTLFHRQKALRVVSMIIITVDLGPFLWQFLFLLLNPFSSKKPSSTSVHSPSISSGLGYWPHLFLSHTPWVMWLSHGSCLSVFRQAHPYSD